MDSTVQRSKDSLIQKVSRTFTITDTVSSVTDTDDSLAVYENRQFGHTLTVPKEWSETLSSTFPNLTVESYMPLLESEDVFRGVMGVGVIDAELYPRKYQSPTTEMTQ